MDNENEVTEKKQYIEKSKKEKARNNLYSFGIGMSVAMAALITMKVVSHISGPVAGSTDFGQIAESLSTSSDAAMMLSKEYGACSEVGLRPEEVCIAMAEEKIAEKLGSTAAQSAIEAVQAIQQERKNQS